MDRQESNKLECHDAARRVVMAYGLAGAHREELKELPSLCARNLQLPSNWIRNQQDRPEYVRYSMISHWG
jgi:hypothetical protein